MYHAISIIYRVAGRSWNGTSTRGGSGKSGILQGGVNILVINWLTKRAVPRLENELNDQVIINKGFVWRLFNIPKKLTLVSFYVWVSSGEGVYIISALGWARWTFLNTEEERRKNCSDCTIHLLYWLVDYKVSSEMLQTRTLEYSRILRTVKTSLVSKQRWLVKKSKCQLALIELSIPVCWSSIGVWLLSMF